MNNKCNDLLPRWHELHSIVFDFDGIFTNNKVYLSEDGKESIRCDRADGLGLDMLRKFKIEKNWSVETFILSKERNPVVLKRAEKIKVKCFHSIDNKAAYLAKYLESLANKGTDWNDKRKGLVYLGNDLNDLEAINLAGFSVCPCDSHEIILKSCNMVLNKKGGEGFVRCFIEQLINVDSMDRELLMKLLSNEVRSENIK